MKGSSYLFIKSLNFGEALTTSKSGSVRTACNSIVCSESEMEDLKDREFHTIANNAGLSFELWTSE